MEKEKGHPKNINYDKRIHLPNFLRYFWQSNWSGGKPEQN